jgi:actin-related protein
MDSDAETIRYPFPSTRETRMGFAGRFDPDDVEVTLLAPNGDEVAVPREHLRLEDDGHTVVIDTAALDADDGTYHYEIDVGDEDNDRGLLARLWGLVRR